MKNTKLINWIELTISKLKTPACHLLQFKTDNLAMILVLVKCGDLGMQLINQIVTKCQHAIIRYNFTLLVDG